MVACHLKQIGKVKKLDKWVPHERTTDQRKKNHRSEVASSVILHNNNEPFLNWFVTCNEKWILYDNQQWRAQWLDQEEAPKHLPKPNLHHKKVMVTVWWSAAHPIDYSFLNPGKTIISEKYAQQINEMHWNLSAEWAWFFSMTTSTACCTTNASKTELPSFDSSTVFNWPLANQLPLLQPSRQPFAGENISTISRRQKMLSKSSLNSAAQIFMLHE